MKNTELLHEVLKRAKNYTDIVITHPSHRDQRFRVVGWCREGRYGWYEMPDSFKVDREVFRCSLEEDLLSGNYFFFFKDEVEVLDCPACIAVEIVLDIIAELTDSRVLPAGDEVLDVLENYDSYRDEDEDEGAESTSGGYEWNDSSEPCIEQPGVYIHLLTAPRLPALVAPETPTAEDWKQIGLACYSVFYSFYEPSTDEELEEYDSWSMKWKTWLNDNIPEEFKQGVHLIGTGCGFMGEDVYVVDGSITHAIHADCEKCNTPSLVWRNPGSKMWCANCNDYSSPGTAW